MAGLLIRARLFEKKNQIVSLTVPWSAILLAVVLLSSCKCSDVGPKLIIQRSWQGSPLTDMIGSNQWMDWTHPLIKPAPRDLLFFYFSQFSCLPVRISATSVSWILLIRIRCKHEPCLREAHCLLINVRVRKPGKKRQSWILWLSPYSSQ